MNIVYWAIVVLGYLLSISMIIYAFIVATSLFNEVPYVPVDKKALDIAFTLLQLKYGDSFIDIGSGDGRVVIKAAKFLRGRGEFTGIEFKKSLIRISNVKKLFSRFRSRISFIHGDMFKQNYARYNKVFLYLTSSFANKILKQLIQELKPGSLIVSVYFSVEIIKDDRVEIEERKYEINGKTRSFYLISIR